MPGVYNTIRRTFNKTSDLKKLKELKELKAQLSNTLIKMAKSSTNELHSNNNVQAQLRD